jgi:hypothetical protein
MKIGGVFPGGGGGRGQKLIKLSCEWLKGYGYLWNMGVNYLHLKAKNYAHCLSSNEPSTFNFQLQLKVTRALSHNTPVGKFNLANILHV